MRLETIRARDISAVSREAEKLFGDDAVLLQTRTLRGGTAPMMEVVAGSARDVDAFTRRITSTPMVREDRRRPYVIALIGPTGAGKTTTIAKLAANAGAFADSRVGLLTLDTYRVSGVEQLATYAQIAGCKFEVAYDAADARSALARLKKTDIVLVDTPGRSPLTGARDEEWQVMLAALRPDEVHLVLPAGVRLDVAQHLRDAHAATPPTHLLLTKLDETPGDRGVADLADALGLPTRWLTDGLAVPADLTVAPPRILAALGLTSTPALA
jgi:flagellar biosynthesis protein FlhF